jgi:simple sugar transport system permease protein
MNADAWTTLLLAVLGGAIRVGTPFLFVSLGECLTEKSGRINLGLEGVLVLSAMAGFGGAYLSGNVWLGVLAAGPAARCWPRCTACCARCRGCRTSPPASR